MRPLHTDGTDTLDPAIGNLPLLDEAGQAHPMQELWAKGTAVIAFLRHFG